MALARDQDYMYFSEKKLLWCGWWRKSRPRVHPQPRELCIHPGREGERKVAVHANWLFHRPWIFVPRSLSRRGPSLEINCARHLSPVWVVCHVYTLLIRRMQPALRLRSPALKDAHLWFIYKTEKYSPLLLGHMQSISRQHKETNTAYKRGAHSAQKGFFQPKLTACVGVFNWKLWCGFFDLLDPAQECMDM